MTRFLAGLIAVVLMSVVAGRSEGKDLTAGDLTKWLCQALLSERPERTLQTFPGAESSQVQSRVEKQWTDRPNRMKSPLIYVWTVRTADFDVEYRYREVPGRTSGFRIRIAGIDERTRIFESSAEMDLWLSKVGTLRKEREEEFVQSNPGAVGDHWSVDVRAARRVLDVSWDREENRKTVRRFCG